jgi:hypothetical protein
MGEKHCRLILPTKHLFHARKVLLHAVNLRHGTNGFTSPPKEGVLLIFITHKNPSSSAGFEAANLGSSGRHATTRPSRAALFVIYILSNNITNFCFVFGSSQVQILARRSAILTEVLCVPSILQSYGRDGTSN